MTRHFTTRLSLLALTLLLLTACDAKRDHALAVLNNHQKEWQDDGTAYAPYLGDIGRLNYDADSNTLSMVLTTEPLTIPKGSADDADLRSLMVRVAFDQGVGEEVLTSLLNAHSTLKIDINGKPYTYEGDALQAIVDLGPQSQSTWQHKVLELMAAHPEVMADGPLPFSGVKEAALDGSTLVLYVDDPRYTQKKTAESTILDGAKEHVSFVSMFQLLEDANVKLDFRTKGQPAGEPTFNVGEIAVLRRFYLQSSI